MPIVSDATLNAREMMAQMFADVPVYGVLHNAHPNVSDPLATQVAMSGQIGMPVAWSVTSTVLSNSMPITWTGITGPGEVPAWLAVCSDPAGKEILFYGQPQATGESSGDWSSFVVEAGELVLVF